MSATQIRELEKALKDPELEYWLSAKDAKKTSQRGHFKICVDGIPKNKAGNLIDNLQQKIEATGKELFQNFDFREDGNWGFRLSAFDHFDQNTMIQFDGIEKHGSLWTTNAMEEAVFKLIKLFLETCLSEYPDTIIFGSGCFDAEADFNDWTSVNSSVLWLKVDSDRKVSFQVCPSPDAKNGRALAFLSGSSSASIQASPLSYPAVLRGVIDCIDEVYPNIEETLLDDDGIPMKPSKAYGPKYIFPARD